MTLKSAIKDGTGTGNLAKVSPAGELIVAGIGDNQTAFRTLNVTNTPFNFFSPRSGQEFFITSVLISGPANATVNIFEASSTASNTTDRLIITIDIRNAGFFPINFSFGGFLRANEGAFINARTDAATVTMTIVGYFTEAGTETIKTL